MVVISHCAQGNGRQCRVQSNAKTRTFVTSKRPIENNRLKKQNKGLGVSDLFVKQVQVRHQRLHLLCREIRSDLIEK